jgi:uncharacterized protein YbjT (DUF2867 family)
VQENPGSVLDWKYEAECAVRASGFPYAVVRVTGEAGLGSARRGFKARPAAAPGSTPLLRAALPSRLDPP